MAVGLIFLLVLSLTVGGLALGITFWATSEQGGSKDMSCGECGYAVKGLTQLNCPECGADLREAGIKRPVSSGRRGVGIALTVGCGLLLLVGAGLSAWAFVGDSANHVPSSVSMPAPTTSSSGIITQNGDGTKTLYNPDGSEITFNLDGTTTLVQPDGTTTHFDEDGNEIETPAAEPSPAEISDAPTPAAPEAR